MKKCSCVQFFKVLLFVHQYSTEKNFSFQKSSFLHKRLLTKNGSEENKQGTARSGAGPPCPVLRRTCGRGSVSLAGTSMSIVIYNSSNSRNYDGSCRPPSWDLRTVPTRAGSSSSPSTSPPTTPSSRPRSPSPPASTTPTSTPTGQSASTF